MHRFRTTFSLKVVRTKILSPETAAASLFTLSSTPQAVPMEVNIQQKVTYSSRLKGG